MLIPFQRGAKQDKSPRRVANLSPLWNGNTLVGADWPWSNDLCLFLRFQNGLKLLNGIVLCLLCGGSFPLLLFPRHVNGPNSFSQSDLFVRQLGAQKSQFFFSHFGKWFVRHSSAPR